MTARVRNPWLLAGTALWLMAPGFAAGQDERPTTEAMREDAAALSAYSPSGGVVRRDTFGSGCTLSKPFEFMACGPMTTISLALMPGMYGTLETTTTQGGQTAQFMDQLLAMGQITGPGTLQELARQADAVDGSSINIVIPLIDYGFTGSFGNAAISMNRAHADTHHSVYQAVGPRDAIAGPGFQFPLSGRVTILEYTPWVLRGTFAAQMVDMAQSDLTVDDPLLKVIHNLSGTFNIIGPWRGDDRAQLVTPDNIERTVRQDIGSVFGTPEVAQGGAAGGPGSGGTTGNAGITGSGLVCDCSCNVAESAPSACQNQCGGTFKACQGEPLATLTDLQLDEAASLDDRVAAYAADLRERFEAFLRERYGGQPVVDEMVSGYLDAYDEASDLNGRISITASAGMSVDCPAPEAVAERMQMAAFMFCQ